jgi:hypothetical protein
MTVSRRWNNDVIKWTTVIDPRTGEILKSQGKESQPLLTKRKGTCLEQEELCEVFPGR